MNARFQEVVNRLLERFRQNTPPCEALDLAKTLDALPLDSVEYLWFFMHPDGKLLAFNLFFDEVTAEFTDLRDIAYGLRVGAEHYPELLALMPSRPEDSTGCKSCDEKGWYFGDSGQRYACGDCHGCGWFSNDSRKSLEF